MLAWRGKTRADLLAALRGKGASRAADLAPSDRPARALVGDSPALAALAFSLAAAAQALGNTQTVSSAAEQLAASIREIGNQVGK